MDKLKIRKTLRFHYGEVSVEYRGDETDLQVSFESDYSTLLLNKDQYTALFKLLKELYEIGIIES